MCANQSPSTNLQVHTHGLHIGGEKHADSVFISVEPGDDFDYVYYIPEDHMPGTHWCAVGRYATPEGPCLSAKPRLCCEGTTHTSTAPLPPTLEEVEWG